MIGRQHSVFKIGSRLVDFATPQVMGIINVTPDSFYSRSRYQGVDAIVARAVEMQEQGAEILDIGAMSSRPGATAISETEELQRLIPAVRAIRSAIPEAIISVDTYRSRVLQEAHQVGADMVNDISGGRIDDELLATTARLQLPYILMHMRGTPDTMHKSPPYEDVVLEILTWLTNRIYYLRSIGIHDIIVDPGFGFGKSIADNYDLLGGMASFEILNCPILVGISRKSMIYKVLDTTAEGALNGTTAVHMLALLHGARILRAHDIPQAIEAIRLFDAFRGAFKK